MFHRKTAGMQVDVAVAKSHMPDAIHHFGIAIREDIERSRAPPPGDQLLVRGRFDVHFRIFDLISAFDQIGIVAKCVSKHRSFPTSDGLNWRLESCPLKMFRFCNDSNRRFRTAD